MRTFSLAVGLKSNNAATYDYAEVKLEVCANISLI